MIISIPKGLIDKYKNERIFVSIIYINNLLFLCTISKNLILRTTTLLKSESKSLLALLLLNIVILYQRGGFKVRFIDGDG